MTHLHRPGKLKSSTSQRGDSSSTALAAVALQDHLVRSLGIGNLSGPKTFGPRNVGLGPASKAKQKKEIQSVVDTGRNRLSRSKKNDVKEHEYVLDPKPAPLTLAQKLGLVEAPEQPLSEDDWKHAKEKSNKRDDSVLPCVICKEDFGTQPQVLLSCTHVFHKACLQAFERFTGKKTCPMCRREQYQTRVIHEGSKQYRIKCATKIQSYWRGYVVRCWYKKLRETVPPKDPKLRQKFYEEKLSSITDRIIKSCDFDVNNFLYEIDQNLERSRDIFKNFDAAFHQINEDEWEEIQLKAVKRGNLECPICLAQLGSKTYVDKSVFHLTQIDPEKSANQNQRHSSVQAKTKSAKPGKDGDKTHRQTVLLSCSHVFHKTCLNTFEDLTLQDGNPICPVCRANYQKKIIPL